MKNTATDSVEIQRKIRRRILPFIFLLYIVAYLDRANVAFVKVPMSAELGFTEAMFGLGAGVFFLGYFLLEVPGALIVERWSARKWLARILITWGLVAVLVGFVRTPREFYSARFLLGAAEAGFYPGIIVYLSHWFVKRDRARATAGFILAAPFSLMVGAPLSALILRLHLFGIPGWRWVFILEGIPAVICGVITLFYLTDTPRQSRWLSPAEQEDIQQRLDAEGEAIPAQPRAPWWTAFKDRNVLLLCVAHIFANGGGYGFIFWLPATLKRHSGQTSSMSVTISALPFALAMVAVWLVSRSSDRHQERKWHACLSLLAAGTAFSLSTVPGQPFVLVLFWLCLTGAGAFAWISPFWTIPSLILRDSAAAASIGLINSVGNVGGFLMPSIAGYLLSEGIAPSAVVLFLAACYPVAAAVTALVKVPARGVPHPQIS
ncbi:MAG: MFS transporter [Bryobacteraceae bacterium]